uniref:HDC09028 n=1 Tax=Drosophila melanogaster TaxID=7227 RepID=Q6ILL8_DROME|nr:TPA_inf: HDC09028 [Drosophila melanogaster]
MAATTTAANKSPQQQQHRRQQHLQWSACIMIVVFGLFSMLAGNCVNGHAILQDEAKQPEEVAEDSGLPRGKSG